MRLVLGRYFFFGGLGGILTLGTGFSGGILTFDTGFFLLDFAAGRFFVAMDRFLSDSSW